VIESKEKEKEKEEEKERRLPLSPFLCIKYSPYVCVTP